MLSALTGSPENQIEYFIRITASTEPLETAYKNRIETVTDDEENPDIADETGFEFPAPGRDGEQYLMTHEHQLLVRNVVRNALRVLGYRERAIIKLRFGLADGYEYTYEEIGHIFRVTRERIRQIINKGLLKLRRHFQTNCLDAEDWIE